MSRIDRNARPSRLTIADRNRQRLAVERWEREQAARRRRELASCIAVWAAVMAGTVLVLKEAGLLAWAAAL